MASLDLHKIGQTVCGLERVDKQLQRTSCNSQSEQIESPTVPESVLFDFEVVLPTKCDDSFKGLTEMLHSLPTDEQPSINVVNMINSCILDLEASKNHQIDVLKQEKKELSLEIDELKQENKGLHETVDKLTISNKVLSETWHGISHQIEDPKAIFKHRSIENQFPTIRSLNFKLYFWRSEIDYWLR